MASSKNLFLIFCAFVALALLVSADESKAKGVAVEHYEGGHGGSYEGGQEIPAVGPGGSHSGFTDKPGGPYKGGPGGGSSHSGPGGPYKCGHGGGGRKGCPP